MIEKKFEILAEEIAKWNKTTFPAAEEKGQLAKLDEEFKELRGAIKDETDFSVEVLGELADCFIVAAELVAYVKRGLSSLRKRTRLYRRVFFCN